ncbi:MAG: hypothetical protein WCP96_11285 [Methylococcaceae bacterium]
MTVSFEPLAGLVSGSLHKSEPVMMPSPPLYVEILAFVFFIVKGRYAIKHSLTIKKASA